MMPTTQYKIVLDTNILRNYRKDSELVGLNLKQLPSFLKEHKLHKVTLAVPELVLMELIQQDLEGVESHINKIKNSAKALKNVGVRISQNSLKKNYEKSINDAYKKEVRDNGIEILITPKFDQAALLKRAVTGKKPFLSRDGNNHSDKGFKDTVIWYTILQDAEANQSVNYLFCTANLDDFPEAGLQEEMKEAGLKSKFKVFKDATSIKEFLDSEFSLRLDLKELYAKIEDEVKRRPGEITLQANKIIKTVEPLSYGFMKDYSIYGREEVSISEMLFPSKSQKSIDFYDYVDLEIQDITDSSSEDEYLIQAKFTGKLISQDTGAASHHGSTQARPWNYDVDSPSIYGTLLNSPHTRAFYVRLTYRRKKDEIQVTSVYPM